MVNRRKTISIVCVICVALIFILKAYYPRLKLLINKPTEVRAADEDSDIEEPDKGYNPDDSMEDTEGDKLKPDNTEDETVDEQAVIPREQKKKIKMNTVRIKVRKGLRIKQKTRPKSLERLGYPPYNLDWPSKGIESGAAETRIYTPIRRTKKGGIKFGDSTDKAQCRQLLSFEYAPWSEYLTGVQGQDPGYNPLAFMIDETHKRGMEFHAWFNPYRVSVKDNMEELARDHPARKNPDWVVSYGNKLYYNPGVSEVRQFVIDSILEVVRNYKIDGVHLDDYFYPYPEKGVDFPDDELYKTGKRFNGETKGQWRRNNINDFIENLYKSVKREKASIKFGVSPFGIWRNRMMTPGLGYQRRITSYDSLYADTKYWVETDG